VTIVERTQPHEVGTGITGNLPANDRYSLPLSKLPIGRSYIALAATLNGVPFQEITFAGQVWRAAPPHHKAKTKRH
jgi:hypothetical protein